MTDLKVYTIFDHLRGQDVPLRASAWFGGGVAAALWERNETTRTTYLAPNHHTLSLYVAGGEGIRRFRGHSVLDSPGGGSLCLMPADLTTDWAVDGPVHLFHLYIPHSAFDRVVAEALGTDPARVRLRDETYFRDPYLESVIRAAVLPLNWDEPAERLAVSHAGQMMLTYLAARFTERGRTVAPIRGGLAPVTLRRVIERIEAGLDQPLEIGDLAAVAGLSAYHFARMFKRSTGEAPHGFVLRRRIELARTLLDRGGMPLAEIALACGFASQSHFTARFRAATGLTPGAYLRAGRPA